VIPLSSTGGRDLTRRLIDFIRSEGLGVGDRLPSIRRLATNFRVSPNVVRDALVQAQTLGLVKIHPRSGAFIQSISYAPLVDALTDTFETSLMQVDHNLFHLLDARRCLEVELTAQTAARRRLEDLLTVRQALDEMHQTTKQIEFLDADVRFHIEIGRIAGNPVLSTIQQTLLGLLRPYLAALPWSPERRAKTDRSHIAIYQALLDGDPERARAAVNEHLSYARENLLKGVQAAPAAGLGS
jgi:GntR family transcriptional repressor for pyruvate dehydrogenase complex